MDSRFRAISAGKLTPLTAGSSQPDQPVEDGAGVPRGTPNLFPGLVDHHNRGETDPEFVRDLPQRVLLIDLVLMRLSRCHLSSVEQIFRIGSKERWLLRSRVWRHE